MNNKVNDIYRTLYDVIGNNTSINDSLEMFHLDNYTYTKDADGYSIKYVIPGASKDLISVKIEDEMLIVDVGANDMFKGLKDAMGIPEGIDPSETTSKYKDGILIINMPSLKKTQEETVEVTVN